MRIRNRHGRWHYRFWVRGHEYTGNTGLAATKSNRRTALKLAEARRQELLDPLADPKPEAVSFTEAAGQFIQWCFESEYRSRPNSARRIETSFASLGVFFGDRTVSSITAGDVERYKTWRLGEHRVREITVRHDLDALSVFFGKFASKFGWCRDNPVAGVTRPSDRDAIRVHVLTPTEEAAYFSAAALRKPSLHDVARLIRLQGCRPDEILTLRPEDIDLEASAMTIRGGKTRAARRTLDLTPESREILARRLQAPGPWVFPSPRYPGRHLTKLNNQHDQVCREVGVSFCLYDLRHTFATRMAEAGVDLATLAAILGHNGLRTVTKYVHPTREHMRGAMLGTAATISPQPPARPTAIH